MNPPVIDREKLINIVSTLGEDSAKGFLLLEAYIENVAYTYALEQLNEIKQNK